MKYEETKKLLLKSLEDSERSFAICAFKKVPDGIESQWVMLQGMDAASIADEIAEHMFNLTSEEYSRLSTPDRFDA